MSRCRPARFVVALLAACGVAGCVSFVPAAVTGTGPLDLADRDCLQYFDDLDQATDVADVRDVAARRVPGFPYLRVDRFLASFRHDVDGPAKYAAWVERMRVLDAQARQYEIANLPDASLLRLRPLDKAGLRARVQQCGVALVARHASQPSQHARLVDRAVVPDDYSGLMRLLGLYGLTGMGFASSVRTAEQQDVDTFASLAGRVAAESATVLEYTAARRGPAGAADAVAPRQALAAAPRDPLGIPLLSAATQAALLQQHAPMLDIVTVGEYDRFGTVQWIDLDGLLRPGADRWWLEVEPQAPTVYRTVGHTRFDGRVLVQLSYTLLFPERLPAPSGDLSHGRLDGLVWRVTLDDDGSVLMYDSAPLAGGVHQFFASAALRRRPRPAQHPIDQWVSEPLGRPIDTVPGATAGPARLLVSSRTHQLGGLLPAQLPADVLPVRGATQYTLADADQLRALPLPDGGTRAVYDRHGIVRGTERMMRFVWWPTGVASAGALRQASHRPTSFIGRRHFDDADLLDLRFERVGARPPSSTAP